MVRNLSRRSREHEIMDAGITSFALFDRALAQIEAVNHFTLGYRPVLSWLRRQARRHRKLSVLDVGFGRGGLLRGIWRMAADKGIAAELKGIDLAPWSAVAARRATPKSMNIHYRAGDVFDSEIYADFIVCSHTTHHMTDKEIVKLVVWLERHARRGWFIVDLQRHIVPYLLAKAILFFAPVNPMVRNDGAVSVARAFTRADWQRLLRTAGVRAEVRWCFPFRYGIERIKV